MTKIVSGILTEMGPVKPKPVRLTGDNYGPGKRFTRSGKEKKTKDPVYAAWLGVKARCFDTKSKAYKNYGGRGITMWPCWVNDFISFRDYLGPRPEDKPTIGRINNDGNYEPGNVEWQDWVTQGRNKRNNTMIVYQGERKTLAEWADVLSQGDKIIRQRIKNGWSFERAITALTNKQKRENLYANDH